MYPFFFVCLVPRSETQRTWVNYIYKVRKEAEKDQIDDKLRKPGVCMDQQ